MPAITSAKTTRTNGRAWHMGGATPRNANSGWGGARIFSSAATVEPFSGGGGSSSLAPMCVLHAAWRRVLRLHGDGSIGRRLDAGDRHDELRAREHGRGWLGPGRRFDDDR